MYKYSDLCSQIKEGKNFWGEQHNSEREMVKIQQELLLFSLFLTVWMFYVKVLHLILKVVVLKNHKWH